MAKPRYSAGKLLMPHPVGHTLRALARWAVAASLGAPAACANGSEAPDMSQAVPRPGETRRAQPATREEPASPTMEMAGTVAQPPPDASRWQPITEDAGQPGDDAGSVPDPGAWMPIPCDPGNPELFGKAINLTRKVDYFGVYRMRPIHFSAIAEPADVFRQDAMGTECATSSDVDACKARLNALLVPSEGCKTGKGDCTSFGVTTFGDEVKRFDGTDELMELLGTIDRPHKAVLVAFWEEMVIACRRANGPSGTQYAHPGNWRVQTIWDSCAPNLERTLEFDAAGKIVSDETKKIGDRPPCASGRRPAGLLPARSHEPQSALGDHFARLAHLEAASVCAFERIADELRAFAAPLQLIAAAEAAACDEVRHARAMTALARSFGAKPRAPQIQPQPRRARFEFALDNAVEGCVRETFGALLAHHQAALAGDPAVAVQMARIAEDETRHAELSWNIAVWLEPQLSAAERAELQGARLAEREQLHRESWVDALDPADRVAVGLPSAQVARALLEEFGCRFESLGSNVPVL
ncbi:MAG TPA: hypothetical protein VJV78_44355 [Polyangiales bacterium]|nr:hypothetical protein [Polyangiales bacterium]